MTAQLNEIQDRFRYDRFEDIYRYEIHITSTCNQVEKIEVTTYDFVEFEWYCNGVYCTLTLLEVELLMGLDLESKVWK